MDTENDLLTRVARAEEEIASIKRTAAYQYQSLHERVGVLERKLLRWGGLGLVITILLEKFA